MKLHHKILIANSIVRAKLFNIKIPIVISWLITRKCNQMCKYCNNQKISTSEDLNTEQIFSIIERLAKIGTKVIVFTGGEPLLREDIGKIVDYCVEKDMVTGINSNGWLVQDKIAELVNLNTLNISLDGPEEVNDVIRGTGSFKAVMNAIDAAYSKGVKIKFSTVLTKFNLDFKCIDYLIKIAKEFNTTVTFQPATHLLLRGKGINSTAPSQKQYKKVINHLISQKNKYIGNSLSGLKYLNNWPNPKKIKCAGALICRIDNQGNLMICGRMQNPWKGKNCLNLDFNETFLKTTPVYCDSCWCASRVEMNYLFSFKPDVLFNMKNLIW